MRKLNQHNKTKQGYYFEDHSNESIKDLSKSISFGMTFIFSFFMAGLTGYYFGTYFLGLSYASVFFLIILVFSRSYVLHNFHYYN